MMDFATERQDGEALGEAFARVLKPIEHARGLPNALYTDADAFDEETARVFAGGWACAGFAHDAPGPGDTWPFEFAGQPLVMVRGKDACLRVFHNVCRHRGRLLVDQAKNHPHAISCPYHSWTYDLDGQLIGAPHVGGVGKLECPGFDRENIRLKEVRSAEWFGLVFIDLSATAPAFETFIEPLARRWRDFAGVSRVHTGEDCSITLELACNWKLAVENYCESYHLPWVHPGLNKYSPLERHRAIVEDTYSGQVSECYQPSFPEGAPGFPDAPGLPEYWETAGEYVALFPNVLLGVHRDHFFAVLVLPDGPGRTRERCEIFYFDAAVREERFRPSRDANRALWADVFEEDRDAVEAMQKGRRSPGFDGGIFSPVMDPPTHAFHRWIARAWTEGRNGGRGGGPARAVNA